MESEVIIETHCEGEGAIERSRMGPMKMARFFVHNYGASSTARLHPGKLNSV